MTSAGSSSRKKPSRGRRGYRQNFKMRKLWKLIVGIKKKEKSPEAMDKEMCTKKTNEQEMVKRLEMNEPQ